ncbi:MAG: tetratricopeptide repeat protein [Planctomycetes bacterium]|nr:tetratricopeptide repeat protein [Planctomycetota bacterium]
MLSVFCLGVVVLAVKMAVADGELLSQALDLSKAGPSADAVAKLDQLLGLEPENARAFYIRGRENFRLGRVKEAVADFDRYVKLAPDAEPRQWERGIALYYAGEYARGARQFELYQTFDNRDVENSVWRFLCMAREQGVEKARAVMLPIKNDPRVPMMQVFELYRGTIEPEQVLRTARDGDPAPEVLAARLFYADLYLGLYFEATGDTDQARKYIELAADKKLQHAQRINGYMWDVASIHWKRMSAEKK